MELKEIFEKIGQARKLNGELYEQGVIDTGKIYPNSIYKDVHLTNEMFFKLAVDYKKENGDEYDEFYEVIDGVKYFALVKKEDRGCKTNDNYK
jgi:hypothetical protein